MAIILGVHASAGSSDGTTAVTPARATTAGSALLVAVQGYDSTGTNPPPLPTITDNNGSTFSLVGYAGGLAAGQNETLAIYIATNIAGRADHTVTVTGTYYPSVAFCEVKGNSVTLDPGKSVFATDAASPFTAGPITPSVNGAALLSAISPRASASATHTLASPGATIEDITDINSFFLLALGGFVQSTAAAYTASWTSADGAPIAGVGVVSLIETGGGGSSYSLVANGGTIALTMAPASFLRKCIVAANSGTIALTMSPATLSKSSVGGYTLAAASSSFSMTGSAANLLKGLRWLLEAGDFQVTSSVGGIPTIGGHTVAWDYEESGSDPHSSDPITTQSGSILVVTIGVANPLDSVPTDNKGNVFTQFGDRINYTLWTNYGVSTYIAYDIVGGENHIVTVQKDIAPTAEITMNVVELKGVVSVHGVMNEVLYPNDLVSGPVTIDGPALLYGHWWGDHGGGPFTADPRDGFTQLDVQLMGPNAIQCATAYKEQPIAGTYTLGWDETPEQGALMGLFAYEGGSDSSTQFIRGRSLLAEPGSVALSGSAATFVKSGGLQAEFGSYVMGGQDAQILVLRNLATDSTAITLSADEVILHHAQIGSYGLAAFGGVWTVEGIGASLLGAFRISADGASVDLVMAEAALAKGQSASVEGATFSISGEPAEFLVSRSIQIGVGQLSVTGASISMVYSEAEIPVPSVIIDVPTRISGLQAPSKTTITL